MVSENDLPEFQRGPLVPVGRIPTMISGKPVSVLTKAMKMRMKTRTQGRQRKPSTKSRGKTRGIEADSRVHFGKEKFRSSQFY
jgi:hypothetical protein